MKIAVMQPYFFPYVGYFKLIQESDVFVFFNDVQFVRRSWINRNRVRCHNKDFQYLTVPVHKAPRETPIKGIRINHETKWHEHHLKILRYTYGKTSLIDMYEKVPVYEMLQDLLIHTIKESCRQLGLTRAFAMSDGLFTPNIEETGPAKRIIEICKTLDATEYLNLPGGRKLYDAETFSKHGLKLRFVETQHPNKLSILDYTVSNDTIC